MFAQMMMAAAAVALVVVPTWATVPMFFGARNTNGHETNLLGVVGVRFQIST